MRPPIGHIGGIAGVGENEADRLNRELNPDHLRMEAAKDRARGTFDNIPEFAKAVKASRAEEQGSGQGHPDHITAKASRSEIAGNQSVVDEAHRMKQAEAAQPMAERQPQFDEDGRKRNHFDTDANRIRTHDIASAIRGRMEAFEANRKADFNGFQDAVEITTPRGEDISDKAFMKAQSQITAERFGQQRPDFGAMADRARSAAKSADKGESRETFAVRSNGLARSEGQGNQYSDMADRARSAAQSGREQGGKTASQGMEQ